MHDDQFGQTLATNRSQRGISVSHEDLRVIERVVVTPSIPEVLASRHAFTTSLGTTPSRWMLLMWHASWLTILVWVGREVNWLVGIVAGIVAFFVLAKLMNLFLGLAGRLAAGAEDRELLRGGARPEIVADRRQTLNQRRERENAERKQRKRTHKRLVRFSREYWIRPCC